MMEQIKKQETVLQRWPVDSTDYESWSSPEKSPIWIYLPPLRFLGGESFSTFALALALALGFDGRLLGSTLFFGRKGLPAMSGSNFPHPKVEFLNG